jgi:rhamnogalacturonyl hydrolase YesR
MNKIISLLILLVVLSGSISAQKAGNEKLFKPKAIKKAMVTALDWQLQNPKHELTDWTNGAFYAGVFAAYETTGSKKIWNAM